MQAHTAAAGSSTQQAVGQNVGTNPLDITEPLIKQLGELFSREDKKSISIFKGSANNILVTDWLKEAERIAQNNQWDSEQKIRFFSDRLKNEAVDWHLEYMENLNTAPQYEDWKKEIVNRFCDASDLEKLKNKLLTLTQKPEQKTKAFINQLNTLYDTIYGKEKQPSIGASNEVLQLSEEIKKIHSDAKKKILIKGLLPKIKTELWPRMTKEGNYNEICELALTAENILFDKSLDNVEALYP